VNGKLVAAGIVTTVADPLTNLDLQRCIVCVVLLELWIPSLKMLVNGNPPLGERSENENHTYCNEAG
jgi:hypothetical protein